MDRDTLLKGLLLGFLTPTATEPPSHPQPQTTVQPSPVVETPKPVKAPSRAMYDTIGQTGAYLFAFVVAVLLWLAGAYFTIAALGGFGIKTSNPLWWMVPVGITMAELWLMPKPGQRWQGMIFFLLVLGLDIASSWFGLLDVMAGRFVPLGTGFTIPATGITLHVAAIVMALIFAFAPEKLGRWAISELWKVWR